MTETGRGKRGLDSRTLTLGVNRTRHRLAALCKQSRSRDVRARGLSDSLARRAVYGAPPEDDMAIKVLLPKFGQTVETSEITQWLVGEGASVAKGGVLCEIATDKSTLEVESQYAGTLLRILLKPGVVAPVGCVMALIGEPGEAVPPALIDECLATQRVTGAAASAAPAAPPVAVATAAAEVAPVARPAAVKPTAAAQPAAPVMPPTRAPANAPSGRLFVSPRARRAASTHDVPLAVLRGSGENGRIVEADVVDYLKALPPLTPAARAAACQRGIDLRGATGSGSDGRVQIGDLAALSKPARALPPPLVARLEKPNPMRRAIAANMSASAQTIPAFQLEITVDAGALIARREADKAAGLKIGYGDYIAKAVGLTIRRHPVFAAAWTDAGVQYRDHVDIGFAVAVPGGLVVPVVRDCDLAEVAAIAAASQALVEKARTGKLSPEDYTGAVFTLSNLGGFPVDRFVAIVPPGQSGILAIGRIRDEVVVRGGGFFLGKLLSLTLSADHRHVDGADGAAFMRDLKAVLEEAEDW